MSVIFLSGSRRISRLNDAVRARLRNMIENEQEIVVGDASGADKAMQTFLADQSYTKVTVFCAGEICRNNVGGWPTCNVKANPKLKGRDYYAQKDLQMARVAEFGFVLWDGRSEGSATNIVELLKLNRKTVVYFSPEQRFHNLHKLGDFTALLKKCDQELYNTIKSRVCVAMKEIDGRAQTVLNWQ